MQWLDGYPTEGYGYPTVGCGYPMVDRGDGK